MYYDRMYIGGVLVHGERKKHKYIDKIKTKTGKWRYIYDYTLAKGKQAAKSVDNITKKAGVLLSNKVNNKNIGTAYQNYDIDEDTGDVYRKNKRYDNTTDDILSNSVYDNNSGLAVKKKEYSILEDMKNVNPRGSDSKSGEEATTTYAEINCFLCSVTYALRRKGYNVTAGLTDGIECEYSNEYMSSIFKTKDGKGVTNIYRVYDPVKKNMRIISEEKANGYYDEKDGVPKQVWTDAMWGENTFYVDYAKNDLKNYPPGSYGTFMYYSPYGGHAMNWEITKEGKLLFVDSQTNEIYDDKKLHSQLDYSGYYTYTRLDDKEVIREKNKGFDFIKKYIISDLPNKMLSAFQRKKIMDKKLKNDEERLEPKMTRTPKDPYDYRMDKLLEQLGYEEWRNSKLPKDKNIIKRLAENLEDFISDLAWDVKNNIEDLMWYIRYYILP